MSKKIRIIQHVSPRFEKYVYDWSCSVYLLFGGYGSGKSYQTALKIIIKLYQEKRKCLVCRNHYTDIEQSCYDLFCEILRNWGLLVEKNPRARNAGNKVIARSSPLSLTFPNGSKIIFRGLDNIPDIKSINDVSIVWIEEASDVPYAAYKELLGRIRHPDLSMHFILTTNPAQYSNWIYTHFFKRLDDRGNEVVKCDEFEVYENHTVVRDNTYYHHSTVDDNPYSPDDYIRRLEDMKETDEYLYMVARKGMFGSVGTRVLPQFEIMKHEDVMNHVTNIDYDMRFTGMDFGFETSYNAVLRMGVDDVNKVLYIYDEIYQNKVTDDVFAEHPKMKALKREQQKLKDNGVRYNPIVADSADPKAIRFYFRQGFDIRGAKKRKYSNIAHIRRVKRFRRIVCSTNCINTIRELRDLAYFTDKSGNIIDDKFSIDAHTFDALKYGTEDYLVTDELKGKTFYSRRE